jgi:hypothetical protein
MPSFGGEVKLSVLCDRFAARKRTLQIAWNSLFVSNITGHFSPLLEVSRVVVSVGAPGGKSRKFQSRARKISLHGTSHRGTIEEEEEEEEENIK